MIQRKFVLRQLVRVLGTATALLATSAMAARAQMTFSTPQQVSGNMDAKGEPEVATGPNGNIYVVWSDLEGLCSASTSCTDTVFFSRSTDGGATYSTPQALSTNGGDPQLAIDAQGNINVIWNSTGPDFARSTDGGATFSSPVYIAPGMSPYLGFAAAGYRAITVDGSGNIDLVWMDTSSSQIFFARSTNGGASFSTPLDVSNYPNGALNPTVAADTSGNIDVVWQGSVSGHDPFDLFFTRSTNGGASFSNPRDISNTPQGAYYDQLSVDPSGNIDVAWDSDCPNSSACPVISSDVFFSQSKDGGATLSAPVQISDSQNEPVSRVLMGFDAAGDAYLAWPQVTGSGSDAYFSRAAAGSAFSAPRQIASSFPDRMSVDGSGAIDVSAAGADAYLLRSTDGGTDFSSTDITNGSDAPDTVELESAIDAEGNVSVVWPSYNYNTYKWSVFASRGTVMSAASLTLNPASVTGGGSSTATVTLNQPAPGGGAVISLTSNNAAASLPASITIAAGSTSGTFTISTSAVSASTPVSISASWNGAAQSTTLTVLQAAITSVTFNPSSVTGGDTATGTVMLSGPAPAGGAAICLSSQDTAVASVPDGITIPETATSGTFSVKTSAVTAPIPVAISACYGSSSASGSLTVAPAAQGSFSVTANPLALTIGAPGQSASAVLIFLSKNGFTGSGTLASATCGTAAAEKITCALTAFTLPANGTATATLTVSTTAPSAALIAPGARNILLVLLLCAVLAPFAIPRRQRLGFAFAGILLAMVMVNVGCGGSMSTGATNSSDSNSAGNSGTPVGAVQSVNVAVTINGTTVTVPNVTITVE